ncbi:alpha-hydroxy-acid oxidizing protein [Tateyamaria sp.]|nr:alpha-hydroxy-acid oxidizing protein [Tateyamaria sp.]
MSCGPRKTQALEQLPWWRPPAAVHVGSGWVLGHHRDNCEIMAAQAAKKHGIPMCLSTLSITD